MQINGTSTIGEILQAINGTWDISEQDEWKVIEMGKFRIFKKLCHGEGNTCSTPLPQKFIDKRTEITPYFRFTKDGVKGGIITLQDTAIKLESTTNNELIVILQF